MLVALVTGSVLWLIGKDLVRYYYRAEAEADLERLAKAAVKFFGNSPPPGGEEFWRKIGLEEAVKDPWGNAYKIEVFSDKGYFSWRSAGPDGQFATSDDIILHTPFHYGFTLDPDQPSLDNDPAPTARDAM